MFDSFIKDDMIDNIYLINTFNKIMRNKRFFFDQ